jgi:uncharacterized protein YjbI with pentapeptide repeats
MPIIETLAFGLGSLLAKEVAKALLGKDSALTDAAGVLVDALKGQGETTLAGVKDARRISVLSENIAQQTLKLFEREGGGLSDDDRWRVRAEVAATIASNPITPKTVIDHNNVAGQIAREMLAQRAGQVAQAQLDAREQSLYERMVTECVQHMCGIIISVDGFMPQMLGEAMRRQEEFQDYIVEALVKRQEQERDEAYAQSASVFLTQYRQLLIEQFDKFELFGVPDVQDHLGTSRRLSQVYVSLSARGQRRVRAQTQGREQLPERVAEQCSIEQTVTLSPRLVITGVAGGGKSTLLKYLAVKMAHDNLPAELMGLREGVPFLLCLRHYPEHAFPRVEDWLKTEFQALEDPPTGWIRRQLENGRAIVMVDGVDELPRAKRSAMLDTLAQLVTLYPAARYIATSRTAALQDWTAWRDWIRAEDFVHVAIDPLSDEQRAVLVRRWFVEYRRCTSDADTLRRLESMDARLNDLISRRTPLRNLTNNPLMCAMVCALYEMYGDSLPQRRTDLYDKCIDMALTVRDEQRDVPAVRDYRVVPDKRALLQHVAAWMMPIAHDEQTSVSRERVIDQMDHWINERKLSGSSGLDMCQFYVQRAELLHEPLEGKVEFVHRTFQEYLTARQLCDDDRVEELYLRLGHARWREVIVLAAGIANRTQRIHLLNAVADVDGVTLREKLVLMLDCMETASDKMTQLQREETVSKLTGLINLKKLYLSYTSVSDVSALAALTKLQELDLSHTGVSDISVLATLINLKKLSLSHTSVSVVNALAGLIKLQELYLSCTAVSRVDALVNLFNLQRLDLSGTGVSDIGMLAGLTRLQVLDLSGADVSDVSPLAGLINLRRLYLDHVVKGLDQLSNLQWLYLSGIGVDDVSLLAKMVNLQELYLIRTSVVDINALSTLTMLQKLDLSGTDVSDISTLAKLSNLKKLNLSCVAKGLNRLVYLQELDLSFTDLNEVSALIGLANLRKLDLVNTDVNDVSLLAALPSLQELSLSRIAKGLDKLVKLQKLDLSGADISDASVLSGLTNLQGLYLAHSHLNDLSTLTELTNLQELDIRGAPLRDLSPLTRLGALRKLAVSPEQWTPSNKISLRHTHPQITVFVRGPNESIPEFYGD